MPTLLVSSKGQLVLPAATRRRLGLGAGSRLEMLDEPGGVRLLVQRALPTTAVAGLAALAGMVTAPPAASPRRLQDFDAAAVLAVTRGKARHPRQ